MNKIRFSLPFFIALIAGLGFISLRICEPEIDFFPGDLGDARFNMYLLEHAHQYFVSGSSIANSYWDAPFMHPQDDVITYSDNLLGTFFIFSVFRILGFSVTMSFTLWYLTLTILNYTCCYFFLKWLVKGRYSAAIGAFIFAFSVALLSQMFHAQTFPRFAVPLAFWAAFLFKKDLSIKYLAATVFLVSYQIYCGIYLGFLLVIPIVLTVLLILISRMPVFFSRIKSIKYSIGFILTLALGYASIYPLIGPYQERSNEVGLKTFEEISASLPHLKSYFFSRHDTFIWGALEEVGTADLFAWWNHQIFPGGMAWLSVFFGGGVLIYLLVKRKISLKGNSVILAATGTLTFLIFLNVNDTSLYKYVMNIPGFGSMRALQRIINIILLFFGIAAAYSFRFISKDKSYRPELFGIIVILLALDNSPSYQSFTRTSIALAEERINALSNKMKNVEKGKVVSYEPTELKDLSIFYHLDAMLASQRNNLFCLNGYSATSPVGFDTFWREPNESSRKIWLETVGKPDLEVKVIH